MRNPHFHVWSPAAQPDGYPDRIVLETGYTDQQAVAQVADGRADLSLDGVPLGRRGPARDPVQLAAAHQPRGLHRATCTSTPPNRPFNNRRCPPCGRLRARPASAHRDRWLLADRSPASSSHPTSPPTSRYCPFTLGPVTTTGSGPDPTSRPRRTSSGSPEPAGPRSCCSRGMTRHPGRGQANRGRPQAASATESSCAVADTRRTMRRRIADSWNLGTRRAGEPTTLPRRRTSQPSAPVTPTSGGFNLSRYCDPEVDSADQGGARAAGHRPRVGATTPGAASTARLSTPQR